MDFDWDRHNAEHVRLNRVEPSEAEEVFDDPWRVARPTRRPGRERRRAFVGRAYDGRVLFVVFTVRDDRIRVITAKPASFNERRAYRRPSR